MHSLSAVRLLHPHIKSEQPAHHALLSIVRSAIVVAVISTMDIVATVINGNNSADTLVDGALIVVWSTPFTCEGVFKKLPIRTDQRYPSPLFIIDSIEPSRYHIATIRHWKNIHHVWNGRTGSEGRLEAELLERGIQLSTRVESD